MTKYFLVAALLLLGAIWSLYSTFFFGWLTAVPSKEGTLELYQNAANFWFWAFTILVGLMIACLIRIIVLHRAAKSAVEKDSSQRTPSR